MEAERDARAREADALRQRGVATAVDLDMIQKDPDPKRPCRREDHEEKQEWTEDRQKDLQAAMVAGRLPELARVSHLLTKAAQEWQQMTQQQSVPSAVANPVR